MAFLFSSNSAVKRPEEVTKIIKGADFWSYRLASDIVHEAFLRNKSIAHAAELAYVSEQARGYRDGLQQAQIELAEHMMDTVNATVSYLAETESQFAALVYEAVKQVIVDYDDKEKTLAVVKSAVSAMRGQKHITLKVNPEKADFVMSELKTIHEAFPAISHIEVIGQSEVPEDTCIVHTEIGSAEASITTQLDALKSSLQRVFGSTEKLELDLEPGPTFGDAEDAERFMSFKLEELGGGTGA
jgi:type III secretion system HrpE/YscL family protein